MDNSIFFKRQSKRSFLEKPIPDDVMQRIYEKVRWSPSCSNNQPWRFVFVTDPQQHGKFMECLSRGNQYADRAPVLVAVTAREEDDAVRDDDPVKYYQFDCGLAVMSLLLASVHEGLMAHPMAGYDAKKLHKALDIPDEYHIMCIVAIGYQGPPEALSGKWLEWETGPRHRKELDEIISHDRFSF
jgi:nitroreductase